MSGNSKRKDKDSKRKSKEGSIPQKCATPSGSTVKEYEDVGISTPLVRYFNGESPKGKITLVECPVCNKLVSLKRINSHMDKNCDKEKLDEEPDASKIPKCKSAMQNGRSSKDVIVLDDDDDDDFRQTSSTKTKAITEPIILQENELVSLPDIFKDMKSSLDDNLRGLLEFRMSLNPFKKKHLNTARARQAYDHRIEDGACSGTKAKPRMSLSNRMHATEFGSSVINSERSANSNMFSSEYDCGTASETSFCSVDSSQTDNDSHYGRLNQSFSSQGSDSVSSMDVLSEPEDTQSRDDSHLDEIELENDGDSVRYEPYYWANFKFIMQHVLDDKSNSHLFNEEDLDIVLKFRSVEAKAQQLYVRLFLRKYGWFKVEKLSYPKIGGDLQPLIDELVKNGLLDDKASLADLPETLKLLSASEVRSLAQSYQIFKNKEGKKLTSKVDLLAAILSHSEKQRCMLSFATNTPTSKNPIRESIIRRAKSVLGNCVRISNTPRELFGRFFSLFSLTNYSFIDDDNTKSTLVYRILQINKGELVFPSYKILKSTLIFQRREDLIVYSNALAMEEDLMSFIEDKHFDKALEVYRNVRPKVDKICSQLSTGEGREIWSLSIPPHLQRFSAEWVHIRICGKSVEALEKKGMYNEAVALLQLLLGQTKYCLRARGPMWERLVIDTERYLKDASLTLDFIETAIDDPWVRAGMRLSLSYRAKRICNAGKNKHLRERLPGFEAEELDDLHEVTISAPVFLDTSSSRRTIFQMNDVASPSKGANTQSYSIVEEYVLSYYKEKGFSDGVHGEGSPYAFIFILLFWDIIFMEIPDVFIGPFQACPLDFNTDNFYENRKDIIDKKLQELRTWKKAKLRLEIRASWLRNQKKVCVGANWNIFKNIEQVLDVVSCLGIKAIFGICELFSKDYRNRCSGMPDLLVWDAASRRCKAVEVKGPGDKLSHRQMIWLNVLTSLGVDAEVCYVRGVGGKRQRLSKS